MTGRPRARFLAAASVAAALLIGASALPAGAAAPTKVSAADCEALGTLGENIDISSGSGIFGKRAKAVADGFAETASDVSDKKLKKALQSMGDFYDALAGADNVLDAGKITVSEGRAYAKALKVFAKAQVSCAKSSLTVPPNVTLPSSVTLPSGVTLPR